MQSFRSYWLRNRFRILEKRKIRYRTDMEYKQKLKEKAKLIAIINRFLSPYKEV